MGDYFNFDTDSPTYDYSGGSDVPDFSSSYDTPSLNLTGDSTPTIMGGFDSGLNNDLTGGYTPGPGYQASPQLQPTPGLGSQIAHSFASPQGVAALLNAGIGTATGLAQASAAERKDKLASEDAKFNAMLQLAQLKYGQHGGGGNPAAGPTMMINAIEANKQGRTAALGGLASNLGNIFSRGGRG